jgi:hypothetical protein
MNNELEVILRTADQTRKTEVSIPAGMTGNEVIEAAIENWALPKDVTYTLVNTTRNQVLNSSQPFSSQNVQAGDLISLDNTLTAGG